MHLEPVQVEGLHPTCPALSVPCVKPDLHLRDAHVAPLLGKRSVAQEQLSLSDSLQSTTGREKIVGARPTGGSIRAAK